MNERSGKCDATSRDQFRRDWKNGVVPTADGPLTAAFASHYNAARDTCFYLLTVNRSASTLSIKLFDINDGEQYGEYLGPAAAESPNAGLPASCHLESMYCASRREWEVLLEPYMEE